LREAASPQPQAMYLPPLRTAGNTTGGKRQQKERASIETATQPAYFAQRESRRLRNPIKLSSITAYG
jgi:hypothetical protein